LYDILAVPAFQRMFSASRNSFDAYDAIQNRKIVLINTSASLLKGASPLFARFLIAQVLKAAYERVTLPESERHPAYLIVDEAAEIFDHFTDRLLAQGRKFGLGFCFATQYLEQLPQEVRAAAANNTAIKMAGQVSATNARSLAAEMNTDWEMIRDLRKTENVSTEWACYIRNCTDHAVKLTIPLDSIERAPKMTAEEHQWLRERNRELYNARPAPAPLRPHVEQDAPVHTPPQPQPAKPKRPPAVHTDDGADW
jgi:hypothetical protein